MSASESKSIETKIASLVAELPDADAPGKESKFTGPPPEAARRIAAAIFAEGREGILALAGMIRNGFGGGEENYKPGYALHSLALDAGAPGREEARKLLAEAVASRLGEGSDKPPRDVQAFLVRELQFAGGKEVAGVLGGLLRDGALCGAAAMALAAIGAGADELRRALPEVKGRNRAAIVQALGDLRDAAAVVAISEATSDEDADVRLAATMALAAIGDPLGAKAVIAASGRAEGWERVKAMKACLLLAERLLETGNRGPARRIYAHLREACAGAADRYLLEAAERGLAAAKE